MKKRIHNRREFLTGLGITLGLPMTTRLLSGGEATEQGPNILLIHVDQHRTDCLGIYGNKDIQTPHIDRLAADGVRYTNSFCPFPVCTPSRYSLLCGRYVHEHQGWTNRSTLASDIETFPGILRASGYRTKAVGKMHFTPTYLDVGFDKMLLAEQDGPGRWDDDYHRYLMSHGLVDRNDLEDQLVNEYRKSARNEYWDTFGSLVSNLPEEHHSTTWIANQAMETLQAWDPGSRQLLMVGFIKPHHPFDPPAPWHRKYDAEKLSILPGWTEKCFERDLNYSRGYFPNDTLSGPALLRVLAYYYASISQIDYHVGRMLAILRQKGLYEKTMIVYTADHGEYMGFHNMLLKGNYMYDPLIKVPLIIKWPENERAGTVSHQMVNNIDLAPTLCQAAGCRPGPQMHGQVLQDPGEGHDLIFAEADGGQQVMARSNRYKLILTDSRSENLFFDLRKDPLEMNNRHSAPEYHDEIQKITTALSVWRCKETKTQAHLDYDAPQIKQPNVPSRNLSHRKPIIQYFRDKMLALQDLR